MTNKNLFLKNLTPIYDVADTLIALCLSTTINLKHLHFLKNFRVNFKLHRFVYLQTAQKVTHNMRIMCHWL